jgi:hypothetical protein
MRATLISPEASSGPAGKKVLTGHPAPLTEVRLTGKVAAAVPNGRASFGRVGKKVLSGHPVPLTGARLTGARLTGKETAVDQGPRETSDPVVKVEKVATINPDLGSRASLSRALANQASISRVLNVTILISPEASSGPAGKKALTARLTGKEAAAAPNGRASSDPAGKKALTGLPAPLTGSRLTGLRLTGKKTVVVPGPKGISNPGVKVEKAVTINPDLESRASTSRASLSRVLSGRKATVRPVVLPTMIPPAKVPAVG